MRPVPASSKEAPYLWSHTTAVVVRGSGVSLRVGARILITGERNGEPFWSVQVISRTGRLTRQGVAIACWDKPLIADAKPHRIERAQVRALGSEIAMFGANANAWSNLRLSEQLQVSPRVGGLSMKTSSNETWQDLDTPDAMSRVLCLHQARDGSIYAGCQSGGVYKSKEFDDSDY